VVDEWCGVTMRRQARVAVVAALAFVLATGLAGALAGCGGNGNRFVEPGGSAKGGGKPGVSLPVTPGDNAGDVAVSAEIGLQGSDAKLAAVELTGADGKQVDGHLRDDASSWVPDEPLDYTTTYTVKLTAKKDGKDVSQTTKFTTMQRPGNRMDAHLYMADNATYGQAMPIVIEFGQGGIAAADRAAVERRLFVTSTPAQVGAWHWDSDTQIEYRSKDYWQPNTKIHARLGLGGLPVGGGRYGKQDITIDAAIDGTKRVVEVDNASKQLVARQDGQVVKTMPVSLGKADKPSFSGTMVIMERLDKTTFDSSTYGTPVNSKDGYRTDVQFAERLTWDGQFIHAAPWSVAQQGHVNVSHGCVNVATDNAQWIYNWIKVGDPVVVKGTEVHLHQGNGWTAWDLSWDDFVKGSALGAAAIPTPQPSQS
jgi:lipoprotein-anchoring transpeptidase ErfK/SrfK